MNTLMIYKSYGKFIRMVINTVLKYTIKIQTNKYELKV